MRKLMLALLAVALVLTGFVLLGWVPLMFLVTTSLPVAPAVGRLVVIQSNVVHADASMSSTMTVSNELHHLSS